MVVNDVDMQTSLLEINSHPEERFSGAHANWSYKIVMGQGFLFVCFVLFPRVVSPEREIFFFW